MAAFLCDVHSVPKLLFGLPERLILEAGMPSYPHFRPKSGDAPQTVTGREENSKIVQIVQE